MDQLKQVLKFQFWILLGIALILPLVGWTLARSGLISEAEGRTKTLTDLQKSLVSKSDDPNKEWESGLELINVEQAKQPKMAAKFLYERQLPLMTWPSKMPDDPAKFQPKHQEFYRTAYRKLLEAVRKIVNPYDEDTQTGLVEYSEQLLPAPDGEWQVQAPSVKQIEAAQEDLWLLSSILKQVAAVNDDFEAKTQFEAPVRQITELYLRGGSKAGGAAKSTTTSTGGTGTSSMMKGMQQGMQNIQKSIQLGAAASGMGGVGTGGGGAVSITNAKISPDEDLGPEQAAPAEKSADSKSSGSKSAPGGDVGSKMLGTMPTINTGMVGSGSSSNSRWSGSSTARYREDKLEYRTRGFYLEVVMDHRRIPELLASLANADWPIAVLRVQESDFKDEDLAESGSSAGLAGMGSSMGSGMGARGMSSAMMGGGGGARAGMSRGGPAPGIKSSSGGYKGSSGRSSDDSVDVSISTHSALDDPNLANVAIVGVIYIFKKPEEKAGGTTPKSPAPAVSPAATTAPVASAPASGAPAAADSAKAAPAATEAASATAASDDAAAAQPDSAAAADKPETTADEANSPADEGTPDKAAPETTEPEKTER